VNFFSVISFLEQFQLDDYDDVCFLLN